MKITVDDQSGPFWTALTCAAVHFIPARAERLGCSLYLLGAMTQLTAGRFPLTASIANCSDDTRFCVHSRPRRTLLSASIGPDIARLSSQRPVELPRYTRCIEFVDEMLLPET